MMNELKTLITSAFSFTSLMIIGQNQPLTQTAFNDIEIVGNDLWIAQGATIIKRDRTTGEQLKYVVDDENADGLSTVRNIVILDADNVWFSCSRSGVGHYDGTGFNVANPMASGSKAVVCQYVARDSHDTPWMACGLNGFYKLVNGEWTKGYDYRGSEMYAAYINNGMVFDGYDRLWWTANQSIDGFGYCAPAEGWHCVSGEDAYKEKYGSYSYNSMAIDAQNCKWLGLQYPAVIRYSADGSSELFELPIVSGDGMKRGSVFSAQIGPDGRVWVAHQCALYAFTCKDDIERIEIPFAQSDARIRSFKHDGDGIWIGTASNGLFYWHDGQLDPVDLNAGAGDITADVADGTDSPVYDIMGRRVELTIPGRVYIRSGRKFVAR